MAPKMCRPLLGSLVESRRQREHYANLISPLPASRTREPPPQFGDREASAVDSDQAVRVELNRPPTRSAVRVDHVTAGEVTDGAQSGFPHARDGGAARRALSIQ